MGIDPVTHKPFSQILSDYGNISSLPSIDNQFGFFFKNSNNTFVPKSEPSSGITGLPLGVNTYSNMMMNPIGSDNSTASTLSLGIVAQFQEINQDSVQVQPHFLNEVASSCSSSSSPHATDHQLSSQPTYLCQQSLHDAQITPSSSFNWSEFLLHDPFSSADKLKQEQDFHGTMMSSSSVIPTLAGGSEHNLNATTQACDFGSSAINIGGQRNNNLAHDQASSSSMTSFVDTILGQDSEMQAAFPELLDASFDY
ncbi:hypothetical protein GBA52_025138 [Prunus armeniaca]|nr:hypothetical protein GBA52_025138 [Prunus armeniaca]